MTLTYQPNLMKPMPLSELSLDILLMTIIPIILVFYVILLVKLKPSKETESSLKGYPERMKTIPIEPKKLEQPKTSAQFAQPKKITNEEPASSVETSKAPAIEGEGKQGVQTASPVQTAKREAKQKTAEDEETKKSFFLFGERNFEGCSHKFGFLSGLPKNTPIPDECFGCPQIVECLRTLKNK